MPLTFLKILWPWLNATITLVATLSKSLKSGSKLVYLDRCNFFYLKRFIVMIPVMHTIYSRLSEQLAVFEM